MSGPLPRHRRLEIVAELCPRFGIRRPCDDAGRAREAAEAILGPADRARVDAAYVLMRAIDRHAAGALSLEDLFRCRILAYYMLFASGGEEWERWGVAASVRLGDFPPPPEEADLDDESLLRPPPGPPWRPRPE